MRRLLGSFAAFAALAGTIGCYHTAGICDCNPPGYFTPRPYAAHLAYQGDVVVGAAAAPGTATPAPSPLPEGEPLPPPAGKDNPKRQ
jgi:hypothetical protein